MAETQIPTDGLSYLQSLMQSGQELMQKFEHALAAQTAANEAAIRQAFESAGIEFIDEDGRGEGVRFRKPRRAARK